jgi:hypothetical protein
MAYTSDDLVSAVRMRCQLPSATNDGKFTDANILELAYEELLTNVLPEIRKARGNYYVKSVDYTVASGVSSYAIPSRAQGASLRDVTFINSDGTGFSLPELPLEDIDYYKTSGSTWWSTAFCYCIENNSVLLRPEPTQDGTLRLRYYDRPGRFVVNSAAMQITGLPAADTVSGTVPTAWSTANVFDQVSANPTFDVYGTDVGAALVTTGPGGSIKFSSNFDTSLAVGDYISLATESPIIQLTVELQPVLTSATCVRVLEALGDLASVQTAQALMTRQMRQAIAHIQPRNDGEQPRIINRRGPLRFSRRWQ